MPIEEIEIIIICYLANKESCWQYKGGNLILILIEVKTSIGDDKIYKYYFYREWEVLPQ